ncbi:MAG: nuclear transport factor 2 family protein [Deltaproteobacteria bacterium]|nr:nuclear transport factor 2 family protein [Deltaproteobacteria bacterium]
MSDANKQLVRDYLRAMASGDPKLPELFTEDVTWWVPPSSPLGGLRQGKAAVLELMGSGIGLYDTTVPFGIEVEAIVADEDWVALQMVMTARTARGAAYRNYYHWAFRIRGGRICAVKEYVDTLYAQKMLFDGKGPE